LSAHYDHLGIGPTIKSDSVYNGAFDNAIGVSVLLELSRAFSDLNVKPKRSIIFIATTGEEKGLLGSSYYVDNPVAPLYKTVANVNIDGIAMFKDFIGLVPVGSQYSNLEDYLKQTVDNYGLQIEEIPPQFNSFDAFNKSDQLAFAIGGVPSILILEGLSNKSKSGEEVLNAFIDYYINKYHSPFDDLDQSIEADASMKHAKTLFDFAYQLANQVETPEWKSGSPFINARLRSIAEKK
jgi:Zn-dependent M28 family amino/carboxypeptidase